MSDIRDFFPVLDLCGYVTGDIAVFATDIVPEGFLECNGTAFNKELYKGLYSMVGDKYGSGTTWFRVPDYRGLFIKGADASVAGVYESDMMEYHQHGFPYSTGGPVSYGGGMDSTDPATQRAQSYYGGNETRPANIYVMFCIKY